MPTKEYNYDSIIEYIDNLEDPLELELLRLILFENETYEAIKNDPIFILMNFDYFNPNYIDAFEATYHTYNPVDFVNDLNDEQLEIAREIICKKTESNIKENKDIQEKKLSFWHKFLMNND